MDKDVFLGLVRVFDQSLEAALITVTSALGSTPCKPGAKMLVYIDGTTTGTLGGGCGEDEARQEAFKVIATHTSKIYYLNMIADDIQEEGMVCGGIMGLFIDYLGFQNPLKQINLNKHYLSALMSDNPTLVTVIEALDERLIGKKLFTRSTGDAIGDLGSEKLNKAALEKAMAGGGKLHPQLISMDSEFEICEPSLSKACLRLFIEPPTTTLHLVIVGAGYIAQPLVAMAKVLGYQVTVLDDRPALANSARLCLADRIICDDLERGLDTLSINPQTFIVIVTRGTYSDKVCLRKVINQPTRYIGMTGSYRKVKALKAELEKEGIQSESLQKLYSPIGLKIRAETPAEIAVGILGQVIKVQKQLA